MYVIIYYREVDIAIQKLEDADTIHENHGTQRLCKYCGVVGALENKLLIHFRP